MVGPPGFEPGTVRSLEPWVVYEPAALLVLQILEENLAELRALQVSGREIQILNVLEEKTTLRDSVSSGIF